MGIALWLLCGTAVFTICRAVPPGRPERWAGELTTALAVSFLAGVAATALDFAGWNEVDWRAGAFVLGCAFGAIACGRLLRLLRQSSSA